jgi:starch phosphorylase
MQETNTWASAVVPQFSVQQPVAYFSIEFGLHTCLPIYSGGLGVLAGDHLKSASDLGLPIVGVSLLYRQGYFQQRLSAEGWQEELTDELQFDELPLELCYTQHQELTVTVQIGDRPVKAQVWLARVGRANLYLLDTNLADNHPADRSLTDQLYGNGKENRIAQEYLLGSGGVRLLQCLNVEPQVYHLNEGHAAFALLELARQEINRTGQSFNQVKDTVRDRCIFTTHTPVPAGHDTFTPELMEH